MFTPYRRRDSVCKRTREKRTNEREGAGGIHSVSTNVNSMRRKPLSELN